MRIVIKVGSSVLSDGNHIEKIRMLNLVTLIADLKKKRHDVILVSSGAVAIGYSKTPMDKTIIENKQALAAIGQPTLMRWYDQLFDMYDIQTAQVLVTAKNLNTRNEVTRINATIDTLLNHNIVPIVNENDATAVAEIIVGDNDQLSAYVTKETHSDLLVILSDIDGYYNCNPKLNESAELLKEVIHIPLDDLHDTVVTGGEFGTGGIITKLKSAKYLMDNNIDMFLSSGIELCDVRSFLLDNKHLGGTLFKS